MAVAQRLGVIDTISAGFGTVNKRLWLIIIPVLLDVVLWLGPKVSIAPLVNRALDGYHRLLIESSTQIPSQDQLTSEQIEDVYRQTKEVVEPIGHVNLVGVLAWQVPSLMKMAMPEGSMALNVENGSMLVLLLLGLGGTSMFGACIYLGAIAQFVRGDLFDTDFFLRSIGVNWVRLIFYFVLLFLFLGFLVPIAVLLIGVVGLWNAGLASLLGGLSLGVALWLMLYLFLVKSAVFVGDVNTLWAIRHSFSVVRRNLWSTLGLFLLINLVLWGTPVAWGLIVGHPLGMVVAITGNAYIATGLAAATMIYYRDRYALLQQGAA